MRRLKFLNSLSKSKPKKQFQSPRVLSQVHSQDFILLGVVVFLSLFGLLMVYDSSQVEAFADFGDKYHFAKQQVMWVILGFSSMTFFSFFDYHRLQKIALPLLLFSFLLLLLVFVPGLGVAVGGAHRWLRVASLTIQPAEIIKLAAIIFFACIFQKEVRTAPFLIVFAAVSIIVGIFQRDLGSAIVFALISFGVYFLAGAKLRYFLSLVTFGVIGFIGFILSSAYRKQRVMAFLDPFTDPQGFSYHISQILIALGSGGLFGLGIGQSRQKFAYIPEVATDSIFSIIGEELGFFGCVIFISLLGYLILRAFKIAESAPDNYGKYLAAGLTLWIGSQAVVNLGAMVSLIPLTGVPLPFISYGGSALLANLVAVGILLNISKQS